MIESFGPLSLTADPEEVGVLGAVDMLDADLDRQGRVRCRDGYAKFTSSALAGDVMSMAAIPATPGISAVSLLAWGGGTYYTLNTSGTSTASSAPGGNAVPPMWVPGSPDSLATVGISGHFMVYNSGVWTDVDNTANVSAADEWAVITRTPVSNRTVLTGGTTNYDRVNFSTPGSTFSPGDWVEVGKADGDRILGAAVYRELTLIFKSTKFFVFYGEGTSSTGSAVFNYRTVNTGVGLAARFGTAVAPEGVYFVSTDGIYLTSGDVPAKVSKALDPLFKGTLNAAYTGSAISQQYISNTAMAYYRERLYVAVTTGASTTNDRLLVYDTKTGAWLVWSLAAASFATFQPDGYDTELMFGYATGANDIGRHFRAYTADAGSAIAWQHTSGMYDVSNNNRVAVTLESAMWGTGTVTLKVANDHGSFDTGSAVTLGTSPAVIQGWQQIDREGVFWQHKVSGSGPGTVNRLAHYVSFVKPAGVG